MKTIFNKYNRKTWIIFIITLGVACIAYYKLPDRIPAHFSVSGAVNRYWGKGFIFLNSGFILLLQLTTEIIKRIDPKKNEYEHFLSYYYNIMFAVSLLIFIVQMITIGTAFHMKLNVTTIMFGACGILFSFIGNMMPKFKHNYYIGIRTSWTLADENVWYLTHRMAAKIWLIGGILMVFCIVLPNTAAVTLFAVDTAVLVLLPTAASYLFFRNLHK